MMHTVTSPIAVISLNGVPSGNYYVEVAAENIVGLGESVWILTTGMYMYMSMLCVTMDCIECR